MKENSGFSLIRNIVAIAVVLLMILWAAAQQTSGERVRVVSGPEDLKRALLQTQLVAPPSESYLCYDGGRLAYVPGTGELDRQFAEGLVERLLPSGLASWPVTVYEDAVTRETVFLNADGTEILRIAAEAGYDPLWAARYLFPGREFSAAAAFRYDPSRVLLTARLVDPDAVAAPASPPLSNKRVRAKYVALPNPGAGYKDYLLLWTSPTNLWLGAVTGTVASVTGFEAGYSHGLAAHADGSVTRVGLDPETVEIVEQRFSVTDASLVSASGFGDSFAYRSDGAVWRAVAGGEFDEETGMSNAVALVAGPTFALALKTDGTVVSWGTNLTGSITAPAGLLNVVEIAAGTTFGVARCQDGSVTAWGDDLVATGGLAGVSAVAASAQGGHCLALFTNGTVVAWGANGSSQSDVPAGLADVIAIAAGGSHSVALLSDGSVVCWGSVSQTPADLTNVVAISASCEEACAVTADGRVAVWGAGEGQASWIAAKRKGVCEILAAQATGCGVRMVAVRAPAGSLEADGDGDGLGGLDEVFIFGTDPAVTDTDGDDMPDGWEVVNGYDPLQVSGVEISGSVWLDADTDGQWDAGEEGVSGVTVFIDANTNGVTDAGEPVFVTGASGGYAFTVTGAVVRIVRAVAPVGMAMQTPASGCYAVAAPNQCDFGVKTLKTLYVNASRPDDSGDGLSWAAAKKTIQAAVDAATVGDTVLVTNGVYNTGTRVTPGNTLLNRLVITNAITVRSVGGASATVIQGSGSSAYNTVNAIRCVYLSNGLLDGFALQGGATYSHSMSPYNEFNIGGGGVNMLAAAEGTQVRNCIISGGKAYNGGGVRGGRLVNCVLYGNWAYYGGAAYRTDLKNCTLNGNTGAADCGGAYVCSMTNSIAYGNGKNYHVGSIGCSCATPLPTGTGNIAVDPKFANAAGRDYRLLGFSPCINTGSNLYVTTDTDLLGNARIQGGAVDMGAYEMSPSGDLDGDGMTDVWESANALNPLNPADAAGDADGDGVTNKDEFKRGTDPRSAASKNRILYADADIGSDTNDGYSGDVLSAGQGPKKSVQGALDESVSGDVIELRGQAAFPDVLLAPGAKSLVLRPVGNVRF